MTEKSSIISDIIAAASARHISQKALAKTAGVAPETLSRLKQKGSGNLAVVQRLANAAGVQLQVVGGNVPVQPQPFRQRHSSLVWSNSRADTSTILQRALLRPQFFVLLDAALEFGLDRLKQEWQSLLADASAEASRAAPRTHQILRNIEHGYQQATA